MRAQLLSMAMHAFFCTRENKRKLEKCIWKIDFTFRLSWIQKVLFGWSSILCRWLGNCCFQHLNTTECVRIPKAQHDTYNSWGCHACKNGWQENSKVQLTIKWLLLMFFETRESIELSLTSVFFQQHSAGDPSFLRMWSGNEVLVILKAWSLFLH